MIQKIGDILMTYIDNMVWLEQYAGVVVTGTKTTTDGKTVKFPMSCDVTGPDCDAGTYVDLIPDGKRKSIVYLEDLTGVTLSSKQGKLNNWTGRVRLVAWYNTSLLNINDDCSQSALLIADILSRLPKGMVNDGNNVFQRVRFVVEGQATKDASIFNKYTYDEARSQYLLKPFDYFAIDIRVNFSTRVDCFDPVVLGTPDQCDTK